jgi:hypothetical protein
MRGATIGSIVVLVVFGLIVADAFTHPTASAQAYNAVNLMGANTINGLLGGAARTP